MKWYRDIYDLLNIKNNSRTLLLEQGEDWDQEPLTLPDLEYRDGEIHRTKEVWRGL